MRLARISNIFFIPQVFLAWNTQPAMQGTLHEAHWNEAGIWSAVPMTSQSPTMELSSESPITPPKATLFMTCLNISASSVLENLVYDAAVVD
ncbi:hypothetical protein EDD85DRAFT_955012 [Armillaria nabsnona]|nr:hypothetical protein EDD85DRAFT_955012 [Armillaria nabsnona]